MAVRGRMHYFIDDHILTLGPGALLWAHADQAHFMLSESTDFEMWVLVLAPSILEPARLFPPRLAGETDYSPEARRLDAEIVAELAAVAAALRRTDDPELLATGLRWWTARAWSPWRSASVTTGLRVHPAVRTATEILRTDTKAPLTDVATGAGLSLSHLGRVFRRETGLSLAEFRTAKRLERVDALMAQAMPPPLLIAALDAGFGSYSQFYRATLAARRANPRRYYFSEPVDGAADLFAGDPT